MKRNMSERGLLLGRDGALEWRVVASVSACADCGGDVYGWSYRVSVAGDLLVNDSETGYESMGAALLAGMVHHLAYVDEWVERKLLVA